MDDIHAPTVASGPTSHIRSNVISKELSLQELISQKENFEAELSALGSVLDSHGVNMNTSLTTFDGFPRSDLDIAQIRTTRARIIRLKNDYKALMAKLEVVVQEQFAKVEASPLQETSTKATEQPSTIPASTHAATTIELPFAKVNTVAPKSPAEAAGLKPGDKVTRFGTANFSNHEKLSKVAQVVQQNENRSITVKVLREASTSTASQSLELQLTPRRDWGGRGLLGCHLVVL